MEKYGKAVVLFEGIINGEGVDLGSGFIVKSDGVIVTNHHVIAGAYPARVKTKSGDIFEDISVIDFNERQDIAIIKVKGFDLPTVILGNSNNVKVGERIVVIGNLHGYGNTISDGLLSQIRDSGEGNVLHQISSPISAGRSGSPVFNQKGEVIGIATLADMEGQNLNFSIPINYAIGMIEGTIRYSLKEFARLAKEPSFASEVKKADRSDNAQLMEKLYNYLIDLFKAYEDIVVGFRFSSNSSVSDLVARGNQSLKFLSQDIPELHCPDSRLQSLKDTLLTATTLMLQASNNIMDALDRVNPNPNWQKASSELTAMSTALVHKIDKEFVIHFYEIIREDNPKLEPNLVPLFYYTFEVRDKSAEDIAAESRKLGKLQIIFRYSTRIPTIMWAQKKGAADRAHMKTGDVILGVVNGPEFKTVMDCNAFLKTTKPGETYTFKLSRNGKTINATAKLE
jgi:S1-C subfamily serine protease